MISAIVSLYLRVSPFTKSKKQVLAYYVHLDAACTDILACISVAVEHSDTVVHTTQYFAHMAFGLVLTASAG